jgi:hypothetical protein
MAKIERYNGNLKAFASEALGTERTVFGDTVQSDVLTTNINADFFRGWGIVGANQAPTKQDFAGLGFSLGQLIAYLHQTGVADWNGLQQYQIGSFANRAGVLYVCKTLDHISATVPESDATNWRLIDATDVAYDNATTGLAAENSQNAIDELFGLIPVLSDLQWLGTAIGDKIALPTHLAGVVAPPTDNASFRYILLTAGESGVGEYNETILAGETVTGSAPLVVATAVINLAASPINGLTVNLLNSEGRYIKPGTSSGTVAFDQMQQITGDLTRSNAAGETITSQSGALDHVSVSSAVGYATGATQPRVSGTLFDSADSPNARTGTSTDVKNIQYTYYMRIA